MDRMRALAVLASCLLWKAAKKKKKKKDVRAKKEMNMIALLSHTYWTKTEEIVPQEGGYGTNF